MSQAQVTALPAGRNTVMIVDDQATSRAILEEVIRAIDAQTGVQPFARAVDAIVWATHHVADLALVDYQMPDMDGIALAQRLRGLPGYLHVPIVMVTVHDDRNVRYGALDAGITDFLSKPIDPRECMARCRNLLTLRRQQLLLEQRQRSLEEMVATATRELRERERETLQWLERAAAFRDAETANQLLRGARYPLRTVAATRLPPFRPRRGSRGRG
ncbi:MAG: response regulator [Betaproteobacteria bacterium]|nr:response regulator [Betaproteobacteria bacterium]